ncbi:MAG: MCP four helix bundle domain-containing protein, partial [Bradyrhizobium sp.]|nr:MCP four helix bundle domain-containing protein [Bradyrhizobium sp.]
MFASVSIRTKVIAVVGLLLAVLTAMGLLAISSMRTMNANTVDITTNWLPSVRVLGELRAATITYRNVIREHMLAESLDDKLAQEKTAAATLDNVNKATKLYETMISSPDERAIYQQWKSVWDKYLAGSQKVMELSRKEAGQVPHEAHALNQNTVNKLGLEADEVLRKDVDLNNTGADKASADAASTYSTSFAMLGAINLVMLIVGALVSFLMVRSVSQGIVSIVKPMQALGDG